MKRLPASYRRPLNPGRPGSEGLLRTDISAQVPPSATEQRPPGRIERHRQDAEERSARVIALLEQTAASTGGILALSQRPPINDVLFQGHVVITATTGTWSRTWKQNFASIVVANLSADTLVVASAPPTAGAPAAGAGVIVLPTGTWRSWPMHSTALSVYGAQGAAFDLAVLIRPRTPGGGSCGTA